MITLNGVDPRTVGLTVATVTGDLAPALDVPPGVAVAGRSGLRRTGARPTLSPRTLTVRGTLQAASPAALDAAWDALLVLAAGTMQGDASTGVPLVVTTRTSARRWTVHLAAQSRAERLTPGLVSPAVASVELAFVALDPVAEDATLSTVIVSGQVPLPVGTAPSYPVIRLTGGRAAGEPLQIFLFDAAGLTVIGGFTLVTSVPISVAEWIDVDCDAQTVVHVQNSGTTRTPRAAWLTAGDFVVLDPSDAIGPNPPRVVAAVGTVAPGYTVSVLYRRRWR